MLEGFNQAGSYRDSVTRFFASGFFHDSLSPKPLKITLGSFQIFSKILGRYSQVKVHHRCQQHLWQIAASIKDTGGKFCHQFRLCCWHRGQICYRRQWHRWQIMGTISYCRHPKVNFKAKIYIYVSSTTQRWPNKIVRIFLVEDFSTPVANLELRISPRIFEKIRNGFNGILWGCGETDSWKEPEVKNLVTLSL